jgi:AAA ATPase domain
LQRAVIVLAADDPETVYAVNAPTKSESPFCPGQPVPAELFVGREKEIERITRALTQVAAGKPQAIFVTGEYGIGKSSLAGFIRFLAEKKHNLFGIHVFLGSADTPEDVAIRTVESILKAGAYNATWTEATRDALAKYVGKQSLFGFSINLDALKTDGPNLSRGYLPLLGGVYQRTQEQGTKGIALILDEINGITSNSQFAHFIKALVDENALARPPLPLLLMLCGVEERRREMIQSHQPVERIFDIAEIKPMNEAEMRSFFEGAFASQQITLEEDALNLLMHFSAGYPKVMHIIGDAAFWIDKDGKIDLSDAMRAVRAAAEDVGRKFVDQQVLKALRSKDYLSILRKLAKTDFDLAFRKSQIADGLTGTERRKFNNFLQKMKKLGVLRAGDEMGEYVFNSRLARLYILLNSAEAEQSKSLARASTS